MTGGLAIIGCGYWGKNLVRNFCQLIGPGRVVCCDERQDVVLRLSAEYPGVRIATSLEDIWDNSAISAVAIATPAITHYSIARTALLAGKHVFVEKPLATKSDEAIELCALADSRQRVLMVDHLLLFHPAVRELRRRVKEGELGEIFNIYSRRTNLGIVRSEENVLWSLGPHDVSVINYLMGDTPIQVAAHGGAYLQPHLGIHDVVFVTLAFAEGRIAHLQLSWLDPHRTREITIIGSRRMAIFDDVARFEKLRILDVGVDFPVDSGLPTLRESGVEVASISDDEPLALTCQHFLESIERGRPTISSGKAAAEVVSVLAAAQRSLEMEGKPVYLCRENVNG